MTQDAQATVENPPRPEDSWFDSPTWGRRPNLDLIADLVLAAFPGESLRVIEVGSLRKPGDVHGDGCATVAWGHLARRTNGLVWSIDTDVWATDNASRMRRFGLPVVGVWGDGRETIAMIPGPVHLLYLDGADDDGQALEQLCAALPKMPGGAVVVVDDFTAKGRLVDRYLANLPAVHLQVRCAPVEGLDPRWNQRAWQVLR